MHRVRVAAGLSALLLLSAGAMAVAADGDGDGAQQANRDRRAFARILNAQGRSVGEVEFRQRGPSSGDRPVVVEAQVRGLSPGFHGFHIHAVGSCVGPDFTSAGAHFNPGGMTHANHAGDLPSLLVNQDGTGTLVAETDRFSLEQLRDADGSAVMVHANRDNFANIPTDRYDPDPDATTLATGDAGGRIGCGQVR